MLNRKPPAKEAKEKRNDWKRGGEDLGFVRRSFNADAESPFFERGQWDEVFAADSKRNVLLVCPQYPVTFWSQHFAFRDIMNDVAKTFAPPLDLLTIAAFFPKQWSLRLVDENVESLTDADLQWADVVAAGCNRVQMKALEVIILRAHRFNKPVLVGGLDPSLRPHFYAEADYLHVGLAGDATKEMLLELGVVKGRPQKQRVFKVNRKLHVQDYPTPRFDLIDPQRYLALSLQFAVGCPFLCEFCEIAPYYGRRPMVKSPDQLQRELEALRQTGFRGTVLFVDDNFVGNIPLAKTAVAAIKEWQDNHKHPFRFYTSTSANVAQHPNLLDGLYEAGFVGVFVGIETPKAEDLKAISKMQNNCMPTLDVVLTIHQHRLTVFGAFVLGFDTEGADAGDNIVEFVEKTSICFPIISLLVAPQGSTLYERLQAEDRLLTQPRKGAYLDSNVAYKRGQAAIFRDYVDAYDRVYEPKTLFKRIRRNLLMTGTDDKRYRDSRPLGTRLKILLRMIRHMGIRPGWRREFWKLFAWSVWHGSFNSFAYMAVMSHHYIHFRQALKACPPAPVTPEQNAAWGGNDSDQFGARDYARAKDGPMIYGLGWDDLPKKATATVLVENQA
jgi:radical SAM superfamily enzyme YgiQ (UPF0313 family)